MTFACTLTSAEQRARRAHIGAIAERALRSTDGDRFLFDPAAEPALRELIALEAECCPFLTFALRRAGEALELTITGGEEGYSASSSATSTPTRRAMSSRSARTASTGRSLGSGRSQST
jgi:hypothetical protein